MADWTQNGRVVRPRTTAKWKVTRPPGASTAPKPMTQLEAKVAARRAHADAAHALGKPCGLRDCDLDVCREAYLDARRTQLALQEQVQRDRHTNGQPCGRGGCTVDLCRATAKAQKAKRRAERAAKLSGESAVAARRRELHRKMLDCGVRGCTAPECIRLRAAKAARRTVAPRASGTATRSLKPKQKRKSGTAGGQPRATSTSARLPVAERAVTSTSAPSKRGLSKNSTAKVCRECLRSKPISAFPNAKSSRCEDCGGQPASPSVRTVQGGAPGLGKRR